jgi:phosphate-selective porin OprO and OprP
MKLFRFLLTLMTAIWGVGGAWEIHAQNSERPLIYGSPPYWFEDSDISVATAVEQQIFPSLTNIGDAASDALAAIESEDLKLKDKKPSTNLTVQIQSDSVWVNQDDVNVLSVGEIPDGAFFRRARFGIFGELYDTIEYRLEFDFAEPARPRFLDNWVALTHIPLVKNVIVGHFFEPFSLERYSPNRFITFSERSLADALAPARNMGIMTYGNGLDERATFAAGIFRSDSDDYGDDVSFRSGYAVTTHGTFLAWNEPLDDCTCRLLHLGGSYSYRTPGDDGIRYAARPSARLREQGVGGIPNFVDTGAILDADYAMLFGLEAAWVEGPWSVQSELIKSYVSRPDNPNPMFQGGYVYGSWFVTGEGRSYSPTSILGRFREGIFQRIKPRNNLYDRSRGAGWTGLGAIELGVRWAFIDLNDSGIQGGYMEDMTYGVNWYLNPYTRVTFNYVRTKLLDPLERKSHSDIFVSRLQFEF